MVSKLFGHLCVGHSVSSDWACNRTVYFLLSFILFFASPERGKRNGGLFGFVYTDLCICLPEEEQRDLGYSIINESSSLLLFCFPVILYTHPLKKDEFKNYLISQDIMPCF